MSGRLVSERVLTEDELDRILAEQVESGTNILDLSNKCKFSMVIICSYWREWSETNRTSCSFGSID
jgi:hypothetical protein